MAADIKGDLYYIDPYGNRWKVVRNPAERNTGQWYWHADVIGSDRKAHRVSASMHRLLTGIDAINWESGHDGDTQESSRNASRTATANRAQGNNTDASATRSSEESNGTENSYSTENARQAHFG